LIYLSQYFFMRPPEQVAYDLIGTILVMGDKQAIITETEAYLAAGDAAAHNTRYGRTPAREALYGPAGTLYIHAMRAYVGMDIVTEGEGAPSSVLIRAVEPLAGFAEGITALHMNGPGKLCQAFGITRAMYGLNVADERCPLRLLPRTREVTVQSTARIGLARNADAPLRFIKG
jgi:DNA-3-methyladenine glycosylase